MKAAATVVCALLSLALAAVGGWLVYSLGVWFTVGYVALCAVFFPFALLIHEFGHILFGTLAGMKVALSRAGIFSPYTSCTVMPKKSSHIKARYTAALAGGLVLGALFCIAGAALLAVSGLAAFFSFVLPSSFYVFLLNALPLTYADGGTDMLAICRNLSDAPSAVVARRVLYIQGLLYEGTPLEEIDENLLFDVPQISEDEPEFIVLVSIRADYYKAVNDDKKAAFWSQRLEELMQYLPEGYAG